MCSQESQTRTTFGMRIASKAHLVSPYLYFFFELVQVAHNLENGLLRQRLRMGHEHVALVAMTDVLHHAQQLRRDRVVRLSGEEPFVVYEPRHQV
jgi:hypothetical protein